MIDLMPFHPGGVAIGIMVGYAVAGLTLNLVPLGPDMPEFTFRMAVMSPMLIQACSVSVEMDIGETIH